MNTAKKIKVLIVDDSDVILHSLKDLFEGYNFEVITCYDGLEGIQKSAELKPDIIFLDLMMPNFDGIKMLQVKSVLKDIQHIPVIVISANTVRSNVMAATEAGAYKVIPKPIQRDIIIETVNEVLGGDHFKNKTSTKSFTPSDDREIKSNLAKFFIDSFEIKKKVILEALNTKNVDRLKMVLHEIKGAGGTIGYPEITEMSRDVMQKEFKSPTDWVFAEFKCNLMFQKVAEIKSELNTV